MITDVDDFFAKGCDRCKRFDTPQCSSQIWRGGLADLRTLCRNAGLTETVKWGHPCYMHQDRNIALIGAFQSYFNLTFFNPRLMSDPDGVLERQGARETNTPGMIRFVTDAQVAAQSGIIRAYLAEAIGYAEKGIKPPPKVTEYPVPDELTDVLDSDPEFAEAFDALTPGRQRGYYMHIGDAKQSSTRSARIEKARPRIFVGKGFNER